MKILLTDEEIIHQIKVGWLPFGKDSMTNKELTLLRGRAIAKAQLKKVVEEGERLGIFNLNKERGIALAKLHLRLYNFWQALLKEVEGE